MVQRQETHPLTSWCKTGADCTGSSPEAGIPFGRF